MNLHWGKTLEHKWVKVKNRPLNYTIYNQYNYTEYKLTAHKYYWTDAFLSANRTGNQSALYAENQFLKKSKIMTDLVNPSSVRAQSFTTVVVIASIFLFLTMTITAAVVVFCRKRNSVFAFQKSEQEDAADYELDDINTDVEYTETEFESETESIRPRKSISQASGSSPVAGGSGIGAVAGGSGFGGSAVGGGGGGESDYENSPARRPLVGHTLQGDSEAEDSPVRRQHTCRCGGADPRGQYQRMVVTAVLEKPHRPASIGTHPGSDDDCVDTVHRTHYIQKLDPRIYYSGFAGLPPDIDADPGPAGSGKPPVINVTYADDPPAYDSLDYYSASNKHIVTADVEDYAHPHFPLPPPLPLPTEVSMTTTTCHSAEVHYENLPCRDSQVQTEKSGVFPANHAAVVFVELPPKDDKLPWPRVEYVDLPPKSDTCNVNMDPAPDPAPTSAPPPLPRPIQPMSVPNTPTTPLAPPSTPTGGVMGIGLSMMGMVSMSPAEEEDEEEESAGEGAEPGDETPPPCPPRRYSPAYCRLQTLCEDPPKYTSPAPKQQTQLD